MENSMNTDYVVVKFISGEAIFGLLESNDDDFIVIEFPVCVEFGGDAENVWNYCPYSDDPVFVFKKKHILYIKPLNDYYVGKYKSFSEQIFSSDNILSDFIPDSIQ